MSASTTANAAMASEKHRRRWFRPRYSLATLFVVVTVIGIWLGIAWPLQVVRQRQATREWIESERSPRSPRGAVVYEDGVRERWNNRGRVEPAQGDFEMPPWRAWLGDRKAKLVAIPDDGSFTEDDLNRIRRAFPEAGIWFDK